MTSEQPIPPDAPSTRTRLSVAGCTVIALALGLAHLQRRSFWQDEAFTWSTVDRSFPALLSVIARHEGYQILHTLIEWPANRISSSATGLRMPSVLAFAGTVPAVWLLGRRLFDERTGLLAALLFAVNGYALAYAQEARGYMLAAMLCAYAAAFLAEWVLSPKRWSRTAWIVASVLAIYAHGFAVIAIGAQVASLWFLPAARRRELHWLRDGCLITALTVPAILAPLLQIGNPAIGFISKPGLTEVRGLIWSMAGRTVTAIPLYAVGVLVTLGAAIRVWRRPLRSSDAFRYALPLLWLTLPTVVLMSVSYVHPIWLDRYVFWSVDAAVLVAAYGLTRLVRGSLLTVLVVLTVGLSARGIVRWYDSHPNQDYRAAMGQLASRVRPGDAIVFTPDEVRLPSEFYLRDRVDLRELVPVFPPQPWGQFKTGDENIDPVSPAALHQAVAKRYPRLWVVIYASSTVRASSIDPLRLYYRAVSDRSYEGPVRVLLLAPRNSVEPRRRPVFPVRVSALSMKS